MSFPESLKNVVEIESAEGFWTLNEKATGKEICRVVDVKMLGSVLSALEFYYHWQHIKQI